MSTKYPVFIITPENILKEWFVIDFYKNYFKGFSTEGYLDEEICKKHYITEGISKIEGINLISCLGNCKIKVNLSKCYDEQYLQNQLEKLFFDLF